MAKRKVKQVENGKMFYHRNYFCRRYVQDVRKKESYKLWYVVKEKETSQTQFVYLIKTPEITCKTNISASVNT